MEAVQDVQRTPPEESSKLGKIFLGAAFSAGDSGFSLMCALFTSIVGYEVRDAVFKQQLRKHMDAGFQHFCECVDARDLYGAEEQYKHFTDRDSLEPRDRVGHWAVEFWTDGASNVLRLAVLRGVIKENDLERNFPRCNRIHSVFDDARLIIGAIEGIDSDPITIAKMRRFVSELRKTVAGDAALDVIAQQSMPLLEGFYTSMLDRYKWRILTNS